jgi:hypothetical protein
MSVVTTEAGDRSEAAGDAPPGLGQRIRSLVHRLSDGDSVLPVEGRLPGFDGATGWLNSEPLTPAGLRGRVVLVNFWT